MNPFRLSRMMILTLVLTALPIYAFAQSQPTPSPVPAPMKDPQAVAFATSALVALTKGTQIGDITLTGTATRAAGPDLQSGTVTLQALGTTDSRLDLNLDSGLLTEIRNSDIGSSQGVWIDPEGIVHPFAPHNCLTDAVWFFPALSLLSQVSNANVVATYIGQETKNGSSVQHLQFSTQFPSLDSSTIGFVLPLTSEDIYLDSVSMLPVAITFNTHPDNNVAVNIPVEIDFSNYQSVNGVQVPYTIQELLNGGVFLSVKVQSTTLNSGLSGSIFSTN